MIPQLSQPDWYTLLQVGLPWIVIFVVAALIFLTAALTQDENSIVIPLLTLTAIVIAFTLSWQRWLCESFSPYITEMLLFDRLSFFVWLLVLLAAAFTVLLSMPYLSARGFSKPEYYGLILLSTFGMGCLVSAGDLLMVYLGIETMSLAVYVLAGFLRAREASNEAALKYFLIGAFASAFLLLGIAFIFGSAGTTNLGVLANRSQEIMTGDGRSFYLFGMAMILIGFGFKVAAVPFHAWAPDVYDGAPTPITTFMATAVKAAAFIAFLRVGISAFRATGDLWISILTAGSIITMFVGNLAAIAQENIKRMLAYSSIAHAGYILVAFPAIVNDPQGVGRAVLFYLTSYILMTAGAFAIVVAMGLGKEEYVEINRLAGLSKRRPIMAATLSLFLVSLLGIPPTVGFFGKYYLFLTAVKSGFVWLVVIAVINSALSAYYYLRPIVVMYFGREEETQVAEPLNPFVVAVIALTSLGVAYFGIFPANLLAIVSKSV
jgi:NADH-quinone oxidoreductase subunit N